MSVGKSAPHDSSVGHVTGESIFIDDRPLVQGELHVGFVGAPVAAGRLKRINAAEALKIPGVVAVFTHKDLHHNRWGTIVRDQPLLVEEEIGYRDEPVCVIAAETREALRAARRAITVETEERTPILSIDEALKQGALLYKTKGLKRGNAETALKSAPQRLSGTFEIGGQEHFYLESQSSIAYPLEDGQLEIHSSSQHPTEVQHVVAELLGLRQNQVVCIVKRMGGGFGGKESQAGPFAAMAALVARKLRRPARIVLERDDDMKVTGKRHPFKAVYEAGFDDQGRILALKVELYANGGAYTDLSPSVFERAVFHSDGAYFIPNIQIEGAVCRTNMHSNTAFRGFGGPQGILMIENVLEEIAIHLKKDAYEVRRLNLYGGEGRDVTHFGQKVENNTLPELYERLHQSAAYARRAKEIREFNRLHEGKLRGIAMTGCKFGIAFNARFLNQANALVNIQRDGTIQVSTGATEMGQGVYTKIRQIVAHEFTLPLEFVQVMATSTEKNANTSPTAASSGADLNGAAARVACKKLKRRLRWVAHCAFQKLSHAGEMPPFDRAIELDRYSFKDGSIVDSRTGQILAWDQLVNLAYLNRFALGEYGFFRTEGLDFDDTTRQGNAFKYFTNGAAVTEVEIDAYTGELKIRRTDLLMDLGRPLNPGIDRGQVIGAFIQGLGWVTTESLWHDPQGRLGSHSPTTYKIPSVQDVPRVFNVEFLANDGNLGNIYGSKAVGEPPLVLSASALMAVKNALSFRAPEMPVLRSPATSEEILMELSRYADT